MTPNAARRRTAAVRALRVSLFAVSGAALLLRGVYAPEAKRVAAWPAEGTTFGARFAPDGSRLLLSHADVTGAERLSLWDPATGAKVWSYNAPRSLGRARFTADGRAVRFADGAIEATLSTDTGAALSARPVPVPSALWSPDGSRYAGGRGYGGVAAVVTAAAGGARSEAVPLRDAGRGWLAGFTGDGRAVALRSADGRVSFRDAATGGPSADPYALPLRVDNLALSPTGAAAVAVPGASPCEATLRLYPSPGAEPVTLAGVPTADDRLEFVAGGRYLLARFRNSVDVCSAGAATDEWRFYDARTGRVLLTWSGGDREILGIAADGRFVARYTGRDALGRYGKRYGVFSPASGRELLRLPVFAPTDTARTHDEARFSPDGRRVVVTVNALPGFAPPPRAAGVPLRAAVVSVWETPASLL